MKNVLVTGAGGTIATEIAHRVAAMRPGKLILLNHSEIALHAIDISIRDRFPDLNMTTVLADVRDCEHIRKVMQEHSPSMIFHAAAVKHVPLAEANPIEAITTNVFGTLNIMRESWMRSRVLLISTDKAVYPSSVMGATKRVAEMICQLYGGIVVRFTNVLDSSGSVMPLFRSQIERGGPVTVTHPDVKRFFISIREAVDLVMYAASNAVHPDSVFVRDGGEPERIVDIANRMIRESGRGDIEVRMVGLRQGEKIDEDLFYEWECPKPTAVDGIQIGTLRAVDPDGLSSAIESLRKACGKQNAGKALAILASLVPEATLCAAGNN